MSHPMILVLGGTGRTGRRVLAELLRRGSGVRAIVRSTDKLSAEILNHPNLECIQADLLNLSEQEVRRHLGGCGAIISCLGHVISFRGVFGPPYDLVTQASMKVCRAVEAMRPREPARFILMSSVSVHRPGECDARRGAVEKAFLWALRGAIPPAKDNQDAADFLCDTVGGDHAFIQWAAVRPDSLLEGEHSRYAVHEGLVSSLFRPGHTVMSNVAHFMCDLATDSATWETWKGKLPVIIDA